MQLPRNNKFIENILFGWFGLRGGYLEYQKSKKIADAMADNEANKVKLAGEIEEKFIREKILSIEMLEQADRYSEYRNLYTVLTKAVPQIQYTGDDMSIDPDKLKRLKDLSKEFENDDLQELVAKILSGEYNNPGTYSLQTMAVVKNLTKSDLDLFIRASGLMIFPITKSVLESKKLGKNRGFIFSTLFALGRDTRIQIKRQGFTYDDYLYLRELGLLSPIESGSDVPAGERKFIIGNGVIKLKTEKDITLVGEASLTRAGQELYSLITPISHPLFLKLSKEEFLRQGFTEVI